MMNPPNSRNTLLVSGLPPRITVDALMGHFCQWGQVGRVFLADTAEASFAADQLAGAIPCAALVVFTDPTSVDAALQSGGPHSLADRSYRIERYRCPEAPPSPADGSPESQLISLRARCGQLQVENQQLASLIPAKDKAARLLLGNVEAWRQKLAWVEKKRAEDIQRLQMAILERQRSAEQLSSAVASLRQQLEEQRDSDLTANAHARWQALLERENAALLAVMHAKTKDPGPMQQLVATLNAARQEMRSQEAENSRLTQLLNQRDAQFRRLSDQLDEATKNLDRLAREGGGQQQQQQIQSLTSERDRLRAELQQAVAGGSGGGAGAAADSVEEHVDAVDDVENAGQAEPVAVGKSMPDNFVDMGAGACGGVGNDRNKDADNKVKLDGDDDKKAAGSPANRTPLAPLTAVATQQ